jgi:filamentous hemagglutinin family protein
MPGELTRFIQQSASSAVLNRITGQSPSQILGALQSNGKVFLINPNGIVFGAGSRVDVNGLVASSLDLSNADFLAGHLKFSSTRVTGNVSNYSGITTPSGGQVYLIAPT